MKKNDFILVGIILIIACAFFLITQKKKVSNDPAWVVITVDGVEFGRYSLDQDGVYEIEAHEGELNKLVIKDGIASVEEANCADKLCVYQKDIYLNGEMIVCLPHQLIIQIETSQEKTNDAVAN